MTTKADTSVKWFHSEMADAPVMSAVAGKLIELLDACLINGFSTRTPDSVSVSAEVATVNIGAGNPYGVDEVIQLSGASNANLNSEWRISASTANSFSFVCPGVADGAVTGVSVKRAPVGYWEKVFSGTNKAVYKSTHPTSSGFFLLVNDTITTVARVRGYESMSGVDVGVNPFPLFTTIAEESYTWPKAQNTTGTRKWALMGDPLFFYFLAAFNSSYPSTYDSLYFGQPKTINPADIYSCAIAAEKSSSPSTPQSALYSVYATSAGYGVYYPRAFNAATPTPIQVSHRGFTSSPGEYVFAPLDGKIRFSPLFVHNGGVNSAVRGQVPGLLLAFERAGGLPESNTVSIGGRKHFIYNCYHGEFGIHVAIDVVGPWR